MGGYALAARAGQPFGGREGGGRGEGRGEKWLPTGAVLACWPAGTSLEAVRPLARENVSGTVIAVLISVRAGQSSEPARRTTQVGCGIRWRQVAPAQSQCTRMIAHIAVLNIPAIT